MAGVTTLWVNPGSYRLFMMAGVTTLWVNSGSYRLFTCPSPRLPAWALLLPLRADIKKMAPVPPVLLSVSRTIRPHLLLRKVFPVSYLCAHREMREQVPSKPLSSTVSARRVQQLGSWGATTWLLIPSQRHLLPLDADGNCTAITFLHRLRSTTSSNALWRLVRMEPPMPSAWDPPLGTSYFHLFVNSWCSCAMLSLLHSICHGYLFMWYSYLLVCLDYHVYMFFIMILAHIWYTTLLLYLFCLILVYINMLIILFIHENIYDAMVQLFIILHVITMQLLFFGIKLCRKLSKFLT
jgi:hypothetical protein